MLSVVRNCEGTLNHEIRKDECLFLLAGRTVCFRAGTYAVMQDVNLNVNGASIIAASGVTIVYKNNMQWFIRGNNNALSQIRVDCANTAFSGFVIWGSGNRITSCSVSRAR